MSNQTRTDDIYVEGRSYTNLTILMKIKKLLISNKNFFPSQGRAIRKSSNLRLVIDFRLAFHPVKGEPITSTCKQKTSTHGATIIPKIYRNFAYFFFLNIGYE